MEGLVGNLRNAVTGAIGHGGSVMTSLSNLCQSVWMPRVMSSTKDGSWRSAKCLFVLSTGRTGSSTLIRLLNLSPKVTALHEPKPNLVREYRRAYSGVVLHPDRYRRLFERARRRLISRVCPDGGVYAEATLLKFFAPVIAQMLPNARFLHLHRHPGEIIRSAMRRRWFQDNPLDRYRIVPEPGDPDHQRWTQWDAFSKSCWTWHAENEYFLRLAQNVGADRVLKLPFDEWTDQSTGAYERVFGFIDVDPPDRDLAQAVLGVKHNEQTSGSFPTYEQWSPAQRQTLSEIAGATMARLGYAKTDCKVTLRTGRTKTTVAQRTPTPRTDQ